MLPAFLLGPIVKLITSKAGPALFLVMGMVAAAGAIAYKYEHAAHLTTTERLTTDVNTAKANASRFETALNDQISEFAAYKKDAEQNKADNEESLKTYARIEEEYKVKEAKYQKRFKQYEQVFIKKPELYSRVYAQFYARGLRELEKITGSSDGNDNKDKDRDSSSTATTTP